MFNFSTDPDSIFIIAIGVGMILLTIILGAVALGIIKDFDEEDKNML